MHAVREPCVLVDFLKATAHEEHVSILVQHAHLDAPTLPAFADQEELEKLEGSLAIFVVSCHVFILLLLVLSCRSSIVMF